SSRANDSRESLRSRNGGERTGGELFLRERAGAVDVAVERERARELRLDTLEKIGVRFGADHHRAVGVALGVREAQAAEEERLVQEEDEAAARFAHREGLPSQLEGAGPRRAHVHGRV